MVAADWRRDERGELLYLFLGKDGLQRDAAGCGCIIRENTSLRFLALGIPSQNRQRELGLTITTNYILQGHLLLGKGGIDAHLVYL